MNTLDQELEELGMRASTLELYAAELDSPPWMRRQDAERAAQLRERQYLLLSGMRKCAAQGCNTLVGGQRLCPTCAASRSLWRKMIDWMRGAQ